MNGYIRFPFVRLAPESSFLVRDHQTRAGSNADREHQRPLPFVWPFSEEHKLFDRDN